MLTTKMLAYLIAVSLFRGHNRGANSNHFSYIQVWSPDLSKFLDISFTEVESFAQKVCEHTRKAYKFFSEPGYLHDKTRT